MTLDTAKLRALAEAATPGPWEHDVDLFGGDEGISACVSNEGTSILFTSETPVAPHRGTDGQPWTDEDSAKRDAQWAKARETQECRDAAFIAACSPSTVIALLDAAETAYQRGRDDLRQAIDSLPGPTVDSDPVQVAKQWNGDSGNCEPDFDMNPDDTASVLASAVICMNEKLSTATARIASLEAENERLRTKFNDQLPKHEWVTAEERGSLAQLRRFLASMMDVGILERETQHRGAIAVLDRLLGGAK